MNADASRDVAVRIGELHVLEPGSGGALVAVGLGSCAGVAVIDERSGACALAHVFLPELPEGGGRDGSGAGTYADRAIPELIRRVGEAGAGSHARLIAVVAGGARMFGARPGNDVGERNVTAVRAALAVAGVRIVAEDVGGGRGRTMRVENGSTVSVSVRVVGSEPQSLFHERPTEAAAGRLAA